MLKEATILSWLHALGFPIRPVSVFLGVRSTELEEHGFGPLSLKDIEAYRVDIDDLDPADTDALAVVAADVAERFAGVGAAYRDTDLDRWARNLTGHLGKVERPDRWKMMTELDIDEAQLRAQGFDGAWADPMQGIARELLLHPWRKSIYALQRLSGFPVRWAGVRRLVRPMWVPAAAAKVLPLVVAAPPGQRVVLVNGTEPHTGRDIVDRAYCGRLSHRILCSDESGDNEAQIVARLQSQMADRGVDEEGGTDRDPYFLVLGSGAATPRVVDALRTAPGFDGVTYVVMAAQERSPLLALRPPPLTLGPDLDASGEVEARKLLTQLDDLAALES